MAHHCPQATILEDRTKRCVCVFGLIYDDTSPRSNTHVLEKDFLKTITQRFVQSSKIFVWGSMHRGSMHFPHRGRSDYARQRRVQVQPMRLPNEHMHRFVNRARYSIDIVGTKITTSDRIRRMPLVPFSLTISISNISSKKCVIIIRPRGTYAPQNIPQ